VIAHLSRSLWVRALVTAGVLAILASQLDVGAAVDAMLRLDAGPAILVLMLLAADRAVMVWRWIILLQATGTPVAIKSAVWIYLVSSFLGSFLPAGVGGDAARAYTLAQRTAQGGAAVASVAVDRLLGLVSIVTIALLGLLVAGPRHVHGMRLPLILLSVATLVALATLLWSDRWAERVAAPGRLSRLARALGRYRNHGGALASVFLLSIAVQVLRIVQAWLMGVGIGIHVPFTYYLLFMPVGLVALMLPISLNGFGVPQGVIVWLLRPVGVQASEAFALSTLIVLSGIAANLPGAWLYLRARRAPPPETFTSGPQKV
jgi:glycosyltransferase 2 family protein